MKSHKVCFLCSNSSNKSPDISFFRASDQIVKTLGIHSTKEIFICELHFDAKDIKSHGVQRRLNHGAVPINFPKREALFLDHSYFSTAPLDLVCIYLLCLILWFICGKRKVS